MKVLVAGGAGMLGSHLVDALVQDGDAVTVVDDLSSGRWENIQVDCEKIQRDVRWPFPDMTFAGFDRIYHLASPASPKDYQRDPVKTLTTGAQGTFQVLDLARRCGARVLFASTSEVYGEPLVHPQAETDWGNVNPVGKRSMYDESKRYAEALCVAHPADVGIARLFNVYSERLRIGDGRVMSNFVGQAMLGEPLTIYGDGSQTRSFCHVDDMVRGLRLVMESGERGPINLGNPEETTIFDLSALVCRVVGCDWDVEYLPLPEDDPSRRCPDIGRAQALGWEPTISLRRGVQRMVDALAG